MSCPGARLHLGRMRRLSPAREALLQTRLPPLRIKVDIPPASLDPFALLAPAPEAAWLEIGFGAGEHLLHQARRHPRHLHIGCEPYPAGVARLLAGIGELNNLRLHDGDAAQLLFALKDACIARMHMLFPDPWPKRRHHKRRMARLEMMREMQRALTPGGELRIATDNGEYAGWILANARLCPDLAWQASRPRDWRTAPEPRPQTRYEAKARAAGREIIQLRFRREGR